jgi:hypothetical protein
MNLLSRGDMMDDVSSQRERDRSPFCLLSNDIGSENRTTTTTINESGLMTTKLLIETLALPPSFDHFDDDQITRSAPITRGVGGAARDPFQIRPRESSSIGSPTSKEPCLELRIRQRVCAVLPKTGFKNHSQLVLEGIRDGDG